MDGPRSVRRLMSDKTIAAIPGAAGIAAFLHQLFDSPPDTPISIQIAKRYGGDEEKIAVLVTMNGTVTALSPKSAKDLADIFEDTMRSLPDNNVARGLADLAMGLRHGAEQALAYGTESKVIN